MTQDEARQRFKESGNETREYRGKPWYVKGNPFVWAIGFEVKNNV